MNDIAVVVPVSDSFPVLPETLDTLNLLPVEVEICFSPTGNIDLIQGNLLEFVEARENTFLLGTPSKDDFFNYSKAYNRALAQTRREYICYISPGLVAITSNWLEKLRELLLEDEKIAAISPQLRSNGIIRHTGLVYRRGNPIKADQGVPIDWDRVNDRMIFKGLTDDCLLTRRVALWDEDLIDCHHAAEWCLRTSESDLICVYDPSVIVEIREPVEIPMSPHHVKSYEKFAMKYGGIIKMDDYNNTGQYYGSGPSFPQNEMWSHKDGEVKGRIVCFLADYDGCGTYRIRQPYRQMLFEGWNVIFTTMVLNEFVDMSDVVVIQRSTAKHMEDIVDYAHSKGKPVIYEIDDFFHGLSKDNPCVWDFSNNPLQLRMIEKIIYKCEALVVSTPELARQYGRFNTNTHIVANCMDLPLLLREPILENDTEFVRIGWAGSATHDADVVLAHDAMDRIIQDFPNTKLIFIATDYRSKFPKIPYDRMEWFPATWYHEDPVGDYYKILIRAKLDIGLAPLADTLFNKCKCIDVNTMINTKRGIIKAGEINIEDKVWNGKWIDVEAIEKTNKRDGLRFTTIDGYSIDLTPEHKMMVNGEWRKAADIRIGDSFLLQDECEYSEEVRSYQEIPWFSDGRTSREEPKTWDSLLNCQDAPKVIITPRWARFFGAFAGDGSLSGYTTVKIHCDGIDQDWIDQLQVDFMAFGLRPTTNDTKTYTGETLRRREVNVSSTHLLRFMEGLGLIEKNGLGKSGKGLMKRILKIPDVIWKSPKDVRIAYLSGLLETDSTVSKDMPPSFVSKSEKLAKDVQRLCLSLGMVVRVHSVTNRCQNGVIGTYWKVSFRRAAADQLMKLGGGFCSARKQDRLEKLCSKPHSNAYREMQWEQKIVSIEACEVEPVDLQVQGSVFSAAGFVSHNSAIKLTEYGSLGIVPVASDVEPYTLFMEEGKKKGQKFGYLCRSERDWYKHISTLVKDAELRRQIATDIQVHVWENYSLPTMASKLVKIVEQVLRGEGHKPLKAEPPQSLTVSYLNNLTAKRVEDIVLQYQANKKMEQMYRQEV